MSIDAIAGVTSGLSAVQGVGPLTGATGAAATDASGSVFGAGLAGAVDQLQAMQSTSDALAVRAVTGDLDDVHDYTIASSQAGVALELTAAIRNKAVDAFNEIMRMQA